MKVLGIETSCDETAVAVLDINKNKITVLSNAISSQVKLHAKFGGVVPNLAAREHVKNIDLVFNLALKQAGIRDFKKEVDLISVTRGPGLGPALLVGLTFARTIAWRYSKPLIGTNHLEGHIYSNWLKPVGLSSSLTTKKSKKFPILNVIVSGGHTELILMEDYGKYRLIGETVDDAIGEAFDKVARLLGLGYPGGPKISHIALRGDPDRYPLPRPMIKSKDYNFSYSGLKTAVLYLIRDLGLNTLDEQIKADIASSFQKSATEVIVKKAIKAAVEFKANSLYLSGGVSANSSLRNELQKEAKFIDLDYSQPELEYTGDNAAMIALAGYFSSKNKKPRPPAGEWDSFDMDPNLGFKSNHL